jgi:hypothetical protein
MRALFAHSSIPSGTMFSEVRQTPKRLLFVEGNRLLVWLEENILLGGYLFVVNFLTYRS